MLSFMPCVDSPCKCVRFNLKIRLFARVYSLASSRTATADHGSWVCASRGSLMSGFASVSTSGGVTAQVGVGCTLKLSENGEISFWKTEEIKNFSTCICFCLLCSAQNLRFFLQMQLRWSPHTLHFWGWIKIMFLRTIWLLLARHLIGAWILNDSLSTPSLSILTLQKECTWELTLAHSTAR